MLVSPLLLVIYSGEIIFEFEYLLEYEDKIEKASNLEQGPFNDHAVVYNSEHLVRWTVLLTEPRTNSVHSRQLPFSMIVARYLSPGGGGGGGGWGGGGGGVGGGRA